MISENVKAPTLMPGHRPLNQLFSDVAQVTSREAGRAWVFAVAVVVIAVWGITGPIFHFSDTWQLVINTGTTIVTFLMVFLIQNSQNRDAAAIQIKLDELIRVSKAHNSYIGVERLTEEEIETIRAACAARVKSQLARPAAVKRSNGSRTKSAPVEMPVSEITPA
jgi:low affinity Fe/Cu permease